VWVDLTRVDGVGPAMATAQVPAIATAVIDVASVRDNLMAVLLGEGNEVPVGLLYKKSAAPHVDYADRSDHSGRPNTACGGRSGRCRRLRAAPPTDPGFLTRVMPGGRRRPDAGGPSSEAPPGRAADPNPPTSDATTNSARPTYSVWRRP
jgi:hypothetical protein